MQALPTTVAPARARWRAAVQAPELKRALERVKPAVGARSSIPLSTGVLIEAAHGRLQLTAADTDFTIRTRLEADTRGSGVVLIPFARLQPVVSRMGRTAVLEADTGGGLCISVGNGRAVLAGDDASEFPLVRDVDFPGEAVALDLGALRNVLQAAGARGSALGAGAVLLDGHALVATDGYRMFRERVDGELPTCMIPAPALAALAAGRHRSVGMRVNASVGLAQLATDDSEYIVRLLDTKPIDHRSVTPTHRDIKAVVTVAARELVAALARLRPITAVRSSPRPPVRLAVHHDHITLDVTIPDIASGSTEVRAEAAGIDDVMFIAFNPAWLSACVTACNAERVSIHLRDPRRAVVVVGHGEDWEHGAGVRLLMPVFIEPPAATVPIRPRSGDADATSPPAQANTKTTPRAPDPTAGDIVPLPGRRSRRRPVRRRTTR